MHLYSLQAESREFATGILVVDIFEPMLHVYAGYAWKRHYIGWIIRLNVKIIIKLSDIFQTYFLDCITTNTDNTNDNSKLIPVLPVVRVATFSGTIIDATATTIVITTNLSNTTVVTSSKCIYRTKIVLALVQLF